jgi:acetoacetyl-CoA reductase
MATTTRLLEGYSGIVTGAARGIGRSIALELGRHGANVAVGYSTQAEAAEEVVRQIKEMGSDAMLLQGNVARPDEVKASVNSVLERFGKIDYLVNNAGITRDRTLLKMGQEQWEEVIEVNLHSIFNMTSEVLPHMLKQSRGRVVNISSVVAQAGNFGQTNYAAAKAGIIGFTKSAALELARRGITVNCIAPGFIETEMVGAMPDDVKQKVIDRIPMGRLGQPEEIAGLALYLLSHGDYITGQVIGINGGLYM